ncbi:active breakpoint cluster region-related protein-like isoform X4 [Argonauta hians]
MELFNQLQIEWNEQFPGAALPDIIPRDQKISASVLLDAICKSEKEMQDLEKKIRQLRLLRDFLKVFVDKIHNSSKEKNVSSKNNSCFIDTEINKLALKAVSISKHIYSDDSASESKSPDVLSESENNSAKPLQEPENNSTKPFQRSASVDYHLTKRTLITIESENKESEVSSSKGNDTSDTKSSPALVRNSFSTFLPKKENGFVKEKQTLGKGTRDRLSLANKLPAVENVNAYCLNKNQNPTNEIKFSSFKLVKRDKPPNLPPKPKKPSMIVVEPAAAQKNNNSNNSSCNSSTSCCSSGSCNSCSTSGCSSKPGKRIDNSTSGQCSAPTPITTSLTTSPHVDSKRYSCVTNNQVASVGQQPSLSAGLNTKTSLQSSKANTARKCSSVVSSSSSSSFTSNNEEEIIIAAEEYRSLASRASIGRSNPTKDLLKHSSEQDKRIPNISVTKQFNEDCYFDKDQPHEQRLSKKECVGDDSEPSSSSPSFSVGVDGNIKAELIENNSVVSVGGEAETTAGGEGNGQGESADIQVGTCGCDRTDVENSHNNCNNDQQDGREDSNLMKDPLYYNNIIPKTDSSTCTSNMLGSKKHKEIHIVSYRKLDGDFIESPIHSSSTLALPSRRPQINDDVMTRSTGAIEDSKPPWFSEKAFDRKRISSPFDFRYSKHEDKSKSHECDVSHTEKPEEINFFNTKSNGLANGKQGEASSLKDYELGAERKGSLDSLSPNIMQQSIDMRRSMAEFTDVDSDSSDIKENYLSVESLLPEYEESEGDANMLKMRERAIRGFLAQEETFIKYLQHLKKLMDQFTASAHSKESMLSVQDITNIFSNVSKILDVHKKCVQQLTPKVQNWSHSVAVGPPLKELLVHYPDFDDYSKNYPVAFDTVSRCSQANLNFKSIAEEALIGPDKEKISLITLLQKPIGQLQQNAIFIQELLRLTPKSHPDYDILSGTWRLTQHNLNDTSSTSSDQLEVDHYLLKAEYLVELLSNSNRKLRCFFLFSDVIVCTKQKFYQKDSFDVKWFIPIQQLEFHSSTDHGGDMNYKFTETIDELKKRMNSIEADLRNRKLKLSSRVTDRTIEKLMKKLIEHQREIARLSGNLEFQLKHGKKVYTLLMSTNYSREEWKEAIISLKNKSFHTSIQPYNFTTSDIQQIVTNCKKPPNIINTVFSQKEEHLFGGSLSVTLHELTGLDEVCGTYCCLELDSCGQFFTKARSAIRDSTNPIWNEEFELELDNSQTLRILCFKRNVDNEGDILLGKSALALSKDWLSNFTRKTISMNQISLVISINHIPPNKMIQRIPSKVKTGVFGVDVQKVVLHQGKPIPDIIPICTREIEKRGLDEVGIYRVSGGLTEVKQLKCAFEKNTMKARRIVEDADCSVHTIAAVLKLYFRELPEPLFTNLLYDKFLSISDIKEIEQKEKELLSLIHSLPEVNYNILLHILDHLKCIHEHSSQNKMTNGNLAVIFGQSLMQPAPVPEASTTSPATDPASAQEALAYMNALHQNNILKFLLDMKCSGKNILKP